MKKSKEQLEKEFQKELKTHRYFMNRMRYEGHPGQTFTQPSLTVPDQQMSVKTLVDRFTRGLDISGYEKTPIYDTEGTSTGVNPKTLDLVDFEKMEIENRWNIEKLEAALKAQNQETNREKTEPEGQ